jgi:hypothetical protein
LKQCSVVPSFFREDWDPESDGIGSFSGLAWLELASGGGKLIRFSNISYQR